MGGQQKRFLKLRTFRFLTFFEKMDSKTKTGLLKN
nr:MAG TPA: hypothetical protein [Caudoviricetes sp.]